MSKILIAGDGLNLSKYDSEMQFEIDHPEFYQKLYQKTENDHLDTHLYVFLDTFNTDLKTNFMKDLTKIHSIADVKKKAKRRILSALKPKMFLNENYFKNKLSSKKEFRLLH